MALFRTNYVCLIRLINLNESEQLIIVSDCMYVVAVLLLLLHVG